MKIQNKASAIILARSGSKGIINKNLKKIDQKTLLEFSIKTALQSNAINNVFVSSDSIDYLQLAKSLGAETILRPKKLSSDKASSEDGLLHAISYIEENNFKISDNIIFMQCTSPFTSPEDLNKAFTNFMREELDSLFSAVKHHGFIWKKDTVTGINHNEKTLRKRRQEKNEEILESGAFYIFNKLKFKKAKNRFFGNIGFYMQDKINSFEIDDQFDLEINRFIYKKYIKRRAKININKVKLIVSDFDGVFTNNHVETNSNGIETVVTNKSDSLAISLFRKKNPHIPIIVVTSEQNISVKKRCDKLKLDCYQIESDKQEFLSGYLKEKNISPERVVYVGNDTNDLTCLDYVGYPIVVSDSDPKLFKNSFLILHSKGGGGALKELLSLIK